MKAPPPPAEVYRVSLADFGATAEIFSKKLSKK
jgi:hypothetical protein